MATEDSKMSDLTTTNDSNNNNKNGENIKINDENDENIMQNGDTVIIIDESLKSQHITIGSKFEQRFHRKKDINFSVLIGHPFGSVFELQSNKLIKKSPSEWCSFQNETKLNEQHIENRNNSSLNPLDNASQKLTEDQILKLKANDNLSKDVLINKIAESSKTFHLKTEFSKEKYIKSKKTKHKNVKLMTVKPTASSICEMYFDRKPEKTMGLRIDTLSQIIELANVYPSQRILCVESCTGLVIGSFAERMNGNGLIFNVYCTKHPSIEIAQNLFHRNDRKMAIVNNVNIGLFEDVLWKNDDKESNEKLKKMMDTNVKITAKYKDIRPSLYEIKQWIKVELCDSLVIVSVYHPLTLFKHLYQYLDFGCPFVVWSPYIEPLGEIKEWFGNYEEHKKGEHVEAVRLRIHENWFREYQVLPQRTHPHVNMTQAGGYILSGIKVRNRPSRMNVEDEEAEMDDNPSEKKKRKLSDGQVTDDKTEIVDVD